MSASPFSSGYSIPNTVMDGLFVCIGGGSNTVTGLTVAQAAQTLTMTARSTNYGYIDLATGLVAVNTTGFVTGQIPLFIAVADTFQVTSINDVRVTYTSAAGGSGTPALPFTSVQFNNSGVFGGDVNLEWNNTTKQLFIGGPSSTTSAALTIIGAAAGNAASPIELHSLFSNGVNAYTHSSTAFRAPTLNLFRSRGTQILPTAIVSGDQLGYVTYTGYDGAAYVQGAQLVAQSGETWDTTHHGTSLQVITVSQGTSPPIESFRFNDQAASNISSLNLTGIAGVIIGWSAINAAPNTGFSRLANASVALGNGTNGDFTGLLKLGNLTLTSAAPAVAAAQVSLGSTTAASATAGGGQVALATVLGYLVANVAGTAVKIPYFSN